MLTRSNIQPGMPIEEILSNIVGYSTIIDTPYGERCAVYADHTATGRPFRMIETLVSQKIKPMIANSHTETSLMGYFSTQLLHYAEKSILKSFKVSKNTHFSVPTGNGATGAFERLTKILRIAEISSKETLTNPKVPKNQNPKIPYVYISPYEHHSNILPWQISGCNLLKIDGDNHGNMNLDSLEEQLILNSHFEFQVVSVSATSNVTSQRTDLAKLNQIIKRYKQNHLKQGHQVLFIADCAAFCSHNRLDLSETGYDEIDFVCISPHKHLGGSESTGVLIAKLSAYDSTLPPSFPGGGTVKAVIGLKTEHTWYDSDPTSREMPGTPNAIGFYRAALTFELQDKIGLEYILQREEENAKYFFDQIQAMNVEFKETEQIPPRYVHIYGDHDIEKRYDVFSFNIYGPGTSTDSKGKTLFHPNYVARVLNDVFGIQVRSGCSCAGPYGVLLLGIPEKKANEIVGSMLLGNEDLKPGWVRLDTFFTLEKYEIDYLLTAIKLIALYGERLLRYYHQDPNSAQFELREQSHPSFEFSLMGLQNENIKELPLDQRPQWLERQIIEGESLLVNPDDYLKQNHPDILTAIQLQKQNSKEYSENAKNNKDKLSQSQRSSAMLSSKSTSSKSSTPPIVGLQLKHTHSLGQNDNSSKNTYKLQNQLSPGCLSQSACVSCDIQKQGQQYQPQQVFPQAQNSLRNSQTNRVLISNKQLLPQSEWSALNQELFEYYSNQASGVPGLSYTAALQLAQDYGLLMQLSIQDISQVFSSFQNSRPDSRAASPLPLSMDQFSAFLEKLAILMYDGHMQYLTVAQKLSAFFNQIILPRKIKNNKNPMNNNNNNQNPGFSWENEQPIQQQYIQQSPPMYLDSRFAALSLQSPSKNINNSLTDLSNPGNKNRKYYLQNQQPQQQYFITDQSPRVNRSLIQKESILKRAEEIEKYQRQQEHKLYSFISK